MKRARILLPALLAGTALAFLLYHREGGAPTPRTDVSAPPAPPPAGPATQPPRPGAPPSADASLAPLLLAGSAADARRARDLILAFPERRADLIRLLRDPAAPLDARRAAAAVLASLPGGKRELLAALRDGILRGLEREALLCLGLKVLEDGELFEREGQPYARELAPGLFGYVRGAVDDPELREHLAGRLSDPDAALRLATARVLRDSTGDAGVRGALRPRIRDADPEVAGEAGAALAAWTGEAPAADPERAALLAEIFDAAPAADDVLRFRLTAPLSAVPLSDAEAARIRSLAQASSADTRRFAADLMSRRLGLSADEDRLAVDALAGAALSDKDADVREAAALGLGRAAARPEAARALAAVLKTDLDWEVRASAARSLGRAAGSAEARAALEAAAASDPDERVRREAQAALR